MYARAGFERSLRSFLSTWGTRGPLGSPVRHAAETGLPPVRDSLGDDALPDRPIELGSSLAHKFLICRRFLYSLEERLDLGLHGRVPDPGPLGGANTLHRRLVMGHSFLLTPV